MANSANFATDNGYIVYWISCVENSYSIPNNTSNVTVSLYVKRTNTGYTTYGTGNVYLVINGTSYSAGITNAQTITSTSRLLISKTVTVAHSATGSQTLVMSGYISHDQFSSTSHSYSQALTNIPRASSITTFSNFTISGTVPITIYRYSTTFTHNVSLYIGAVKVAERDGLGTNANMTLTSTENNILYNAMKAVSTATVTVYCATMSGSTQIGSTVSKTATATVSASIVPTLTSITATGVNATTGTYIKNITPITFSVNGGAGASYSTITNYKVVFNGVTYSSPTAWQALTGLINASGVVTATGTVTDSRGRTASKTIDITLLDYTTPTISAFTVERAIDAGGVANVMGEFARITTAGTVKSLINGTEKNLLTYNIYSKLRSDTDWGTPIKTATSGLALNTFISLGTYTATNSYDFKLEVTDIFNTVISTVAMGTALVTMSWGKTGVGIGKVWEAGALDVGGDVAVEGSITVTNQLYMGGNDGSMIRDVAGADFLNIHNTAGHTHLRNTTGNLYEDSASINLRSETGTQRMTIDVNGVTAISGFNGIGRKPAYTYSTTVPNGAYVTITHNLGYYPILSWSGSCGNIILTRADTSVNAVQVYVYSTGGATFVGKIYMY